MVTAETIDWVSHAQSNINKSQPINFHNQNQAQEAKEQREIDEERE